MAPFERTGQRDMEYSAWHRPDSIGRFVKNAGEMTMLDIDHIGIWIEYDYGRREPLFIVETAEHTPKNYQKDWSVIMSLAERITPPIRIYLAYYTLSEELNPKAQFPVRDIQSFRVRQLFPDTENEFKTYTPKQWAQELWQIRQNTLLNVRASRISSEPQSTGLIRSQESLFGGEM